MEGESYNTNYHLQQEEAAKEVTDLNEEADKVFTDLNAMEFNAEPTNKKVIEVMVDGKMEVYEIRPAELFGGEDSLDSGTFSSSSLSHHTPWDENTEEYSDIDLMTPTSSTNNHMMPPTMTTNHHMITPNTTHIYDSPPGTGFSHPMDNYSRYQVSDTAAYYENTFHLSYNMGNTLQTELSYPLHPPPPSHTILIQRAHTKRSKNGGEGTKYPEDRVKREQYKKAACERERARMKDCNKIFQQLRNRIPQPQGKRLSKTESLRLAIKYIKHLKYLLSIPEGQQIPQEVISFDPSSHAWDRMEALGGEPGRHYRDEFQRQASRYDMKTEETLMRQDMW